MSVKTCAATSGEETFLVVTERMVSALCLCVQKGFLPSGLLAIHGQELNVLLRAFVKFYFHALRSMRLFCP
jgi:hypothetical protein